MKSRVGSRYIGNGVVRNSGGGDQSTSMAIVNSSDDTSGSLSVSNLLKGLRLGLSLAVSMEIRVGMIGRIGNMWNNTNSRYQSCSMAIAYSSDDSSISLSSSNLCNSVGLRLSLGLSFAIVDIGIAGVDTGIGIASIDTSGVTNRDGTNCFDTSLGSIGDHSNIVKTTFSQGILHW